MESRGSTVRYQPWYERWPDLVEWERERFKEHGLPWVVNAEAQAHGFLVVESAVEFRGEKVRIRVVYPSETPELPATVYSDPPILDRHQQPFRGNFCLLARPEDDWKAQEWGAGDLIQERLRSLLADSEAGEQVVRDNEAPIPEPWSAHFGYEGNTVVLIPGNLASPSGTEGGLKLREFDRDRFVLTEIDRKPGDTGLLTAFTQGKEAAGRWKRLDRGPEPEGPDGQAMLSWLRREHPGLVRSRSLPPKLRGKKHVRQPGREVIGLVFPEEALPDGKTRDGWIFLAVEQGSEGRLLHAQVTSVEERSRRIPELEDLTHRKAVVVGLGSLGGELAVQLARAGVGRLHLIDHDRFEANNAVRHVLGVEQAGRNKAQAVADACRRANPFCELTGHGDLHFGGTTDPSPLEILHGELDDADLVVETTGVHQLQLLVSRVAWEFGKPAVLSWLTDGSWAGEVARLVPSKTACAVCFSKRQSEGVVLIGEADSDAAVFAQGCAHPTTTGAGFEASEVVSNTARLIASTLADKYSETDWDHAVFNFRRRPDDQEHPRFAVEELERSEECETCGPDAG